MLCTCRCHLFTPDPVYLGLVLHQRVFSLSIAIPQLDPGPGMQDHSLAAYCLLLPGKTLHISALLAAKRFRDKGNKDGAVRAIKTLQDAGLGQVVENKPLRGTTMVLQVPLQVYYTVIYKPVYFFPHPRPCRRTGLTKLLFRRLRMKKYLSLQSCCCLVFPCSSMQIPFSRKR